MKSKLRKFFGLASFGVAIALTISAMPAFGAEHIKANIQFPFMVGTKTMPAGAYEFVVDNDHMRTEVLGDRAKKEPSAMVEIIAMIAPPQHSSSEHSHLVFDKVGNTYSLSELWEPGYEGVLVHTTKGPHEHHVVHVTR